MACFTAAFLGNTMYQFNNSNHGHFIMADLLLTISSFQLPVLLCFITLKQLKIFSFLNIMMQKFSIFAYFHSDSIRLS